MRWIPDLRGADRMSSVESRNRVGMPRACYAAVDPTICVEVVEIDTVLPHVGVVLRKDDSPAQSLRTSPNGITSAMNQDWLLQTKETRRTFSNATWVPLRASINDEHGEVRAIGYVSEFFGCGSVAFPPEHRGTAERLDWMDLGLIHNAQPYAYEDGCYASIEQYQLNDKEPIGIHLVFDHPQHVVGGRLWILNPDQGSRGQGD